jgi:hypothetical protein
MSYLNSVLCFCHSAIKKYLDILKLWYETSVQDPDPHGFGPVSLTRIQALGKWPKKTHIFTLILISDFSQTIFLLTLYITMFETYLSKETKKMRLVQILKPGVVYK